LNNILLNRSKSDKTFGLLIDYDYAEFIVINEPDFKSATTFDAIDTTATSLRTVSPKNFFYMVD